MRKPSPRIDSASTSPVPSTPAVPQSTRRRFLFALSAGGAGAVAAAAAPALARPVEGAAIAADASTSGYRETDHVRDYYATTRL